MKCVIRFFCLVQCLLVLVMACSKDTESGPVMGNSSLDSLFLKCEPSSLIFTSKGGSSNVKITTEGKWHIYSIPNWLTVSPIEGEGEQIVLITAEPNTDRLHDRSRDLLITWVAGETNTNRSNYEVYQLKDTLQVTPMSFFEDGIAQDNKKLKISTARRWMASSNQQWCKLDIEKGEADAEISLILEENNTLQAREAIVTIETRTTNYAQFEEVNVVVQQQSRNLPFVLIKNIKENTVSSNTADVEFTYFMGVAGSGYTSQPVTEIGVCYSATTSIPDIENSTVKKKEIPSAYVSSVTETISGLLPATRYYVRAYAKCAYGIGYSQVISFETK